MTSTKTEVQTVKTQTRSNLDITCDVLDEIFEAIFNNTVNFNAKINKHSVNKEVLGTIAYFAEQFAGISNYLDDYKWNDDASLIEDLIETFASYKQEATKLEWESGNTKTENDDGDDDDDDGDKEAQKIINNFCKGKDLIEEAQDEALYVLNHPDEYQLSKEQLCDLQNIVEDEA